MNLDNCENCQNLKTCDIVALNMKMACPHHFDCQKSESTTETPSTTTEKTAKKNDVEFIFIGAFSAIGVCVCVVLALIKRKYIW